MAKVGDQKHSLYTQTQSRIKKTEHVVMAMVEDKPGVLSRISGLFRRRGFNIKSLTVGPSETKGLSRMTIVVDWSKTDTEQVMKQLYKVIEVVEVKDLSQCDAIVQELALIKVSSKHTNKSEIVRVVDMYQGKIMDVGDDSVIVEITGDSQEIDSFLDLVKAFGVQELSRTGVTAMSRANG